MNQSVQSNNRSILIACHRPVVSGGILRLENSGAVWRRRGHNVTFLQFEEGDLGRTVDFPILDLHEAKNREWNITIVPGAGFPQKTIELLEELHADQFGARIQLVLNDRSQRASFLRVNSIFCPHVVVFNNRDWFSGSFTEFQADRFHTVVGGIDTNRFARENERPRDNRKWIIGGLANKNPGPLLESMLSMPPHVQLRLFGKDAYDLARSHSDLIESGRLQLHGILLGDELVDFYHQLDAVVSTELYAGWSNLGAEALASGIPLICTSHGTSEFAIPNETAIVLTEPAPAEILHATNRLIASPELCKRLSKKGQLRIAAFDWEQYAAALLDVCYVDGIRHYTAAPEIGLHGKWPISHRLSGLDLVLVSAENSTVLDLGAGDGVVARELLARGASLLHGFEIDTGRLEIATRLTSGLGSSHFEFADLSRWDQFISNTEQKLLAAYDIVLYLGLHHHLPPSSRERSLRGALSLARDLFAIRTPQQYFDLDQIQNIVESFGFDLMTTSEDTASAQGVARVFKRRHWQRL